MTSPAAHFEFPEDPDTECPFCLSSHTAYCDEDKTSYVYWCKDCGHLFDEEFRFSRVDALIDSWKDRD